MATTTRMSPGVLSISRELRAMAGAYIGRAVTPRQRSFQSNGTVWRYHLIGNALVLAPRPTGIINQLIPAGWIAFAKLIAPVAGVAYRPGNAVVGVDDGNTVAHLHV